MNFYLVDFFAVRLLVRVQGRRRGQALGAVGALVVADAQVRGLLVHRLRPVLGERLLAVLALVGALARVRPLVDLQGGLLGERPKKDAICKIFLNYNDI
jgi:hypothetical protein